MKTIKKIISFILILCCMYVTAKFPKAVIFVTEFGYQAGKTAVVAVIDMIRSDDNGGDSQDGYQESTL